MHKSSMRKFLFSFAFVSLLASLACTPLQGAGQRPAGTRLVQMRIADDVVDSLGHQVSGLQLLAVTIRDGQLSLTASAIVDPAESRALFFYLAQDSSPVLMLQSPGGDRSSPGSLIGRLLIDDGLGGSRSRLPAGSADLDLGQPQLVGSQAPYGLEVAESNNPMLLIDTDADGQSDFADSDDDNDGQEDLVDSDADGDGLEDAQQGFSALPDSDADGVPDLFEDN